MQHRYRATAAGRRPARLVVALPAAGAAPAASPDGFTHGVASVIVDADMALDDARAHFEEVRAVSLRRWPELDRQSIFEVTEDSPAEKP
jgi:hypothetical protein